MTGNEKKEYLLQKGIKLSRIFCEENGLKVPEYKMLDESRRKIDGYCGLYTKNTVHVSVKRSAFMAPMAFCRQWSFPGYRIDRTPYGVVAHETGHHVDACLGIPSRRFPKTKKQVSNYEPSKSEAFAESLKIFITNPTLLQAGIPERYNFIIALGIKPVITRHYTELMKGRFLEQAEKWILK